MKKSIPFIFNLILTILLTLEIILRAILLSFNNTIRSVFLLLIPMLLMNYIISLQNQRSSPWKTKFIFLILTAVFILEMINFFFHSVISPPLFNILTIITCLGLMNIFSNQLWFLQDLNIKKWSFRLSIMLLSATFFLYIPLLHFSGNFYHLSLHFLTILTLCFEGSLLLFSFQYVFIPGFAKSKRLVRIIYYFIYILFLVFVILGLGRNLNSINSYNWLVSLQIFVVISLVAEACITGVSNYFATKNKLLIFAISILPLIYTFENNYFGLTFLKNLLQKSTVFITHFAVIFSVFTLVYYLVETGLLWYAYGTKHYTSELKDIAIATNYHIIVLIPCMNEELVIKNTVKSLLDTAYDQLDVFVIDDASADNTVNELAEFKENKHFHLLQRFKPQAQQGKGEALNWAYNTIAADYREKGRIFEETLITIIDADTSVEKDYFDKVNLVFNSDFELTGLQSKVQIINRTSDSAQDLEFREIINATQSLRSKTNTVAFGGNGQFCKLSTLYSLKKNPWTKSLVEDFDLSLRLFLSEIYNVRNVQFDDIKITQTGIYNDPEALVRQRVRWAQGNLQSIKYLLPILSSKYLYGLQKTELIFTLIKPWLMTIQYIIFIYIGMLIWGTALLRGYTAQVQNFIVTFTLMVLLIFLINSVWAYLYNKSSRNSFHISNVFKDAFHLTKFFIILSQIYPQASYRYFNAVNNWEKTKRQK